MKTTIDHTIRQKMGITCDEYVVLELIMKDSKNTSVYFAPKDFIEVFESLLEKGYTERFNGIHDGKLTEKALAFFKPNNTILVAEIVTLLNKVCGTSYRASSKDTEKVISARIKDGYTFEDFMRVIQFKCIDWKGTDQEQYLRPITLFGNKFESYLQGAIKSLPKEPENTNMKGMVM